MKEGVGQSRVSLITAMSCRHKDEQEEIEDLTEGGKFARTGLSIARMWIYDSASTPAFFTDEVPLLLSPERFDTIHSATLSAYGCFARGMGGLDMTFFTTSAAFFLTLGRGSRHI